MSESKGHSGRNKYAALNELVRTNSVKVITRIDGAPTWMRIAVQQIDEYFDGKRNSFNIEIDTDGTEFQKRVWAETSRIPYGRTVSYSELAGKSGSPGAARAIGAAMGANPIPVIIPCHRVIGADGSLHGFAMGLDVKKKLLALEKVII